MRKVFRSLILIVAIGAMTSCNSNKKATVTETETEVVKVNTPEETAVSQEEQKNSTISVEGKVSEINKGKDGYTATLATADGIYFATISIPNLKDPKQYRAVTVGETIKVTGDSWKMENDNYITVRELMK